MKARKTKQGFTLIELLIVIAIIGLLATLAIVSLSTAQQKARDAKRLADVKQIQNAVELYYSENSMYPNSISPAADTWTEFGSTISAYITTVPIDPTNDSSKYYVYGSEDQVGTVIAEYFVGAALEADNAALDGDDDVSYSGSLSGWASLGTVLSTDSAPTAGTTYDCVDGTSNHYCVSE